MRIAVMGTGGVGGYFGARLAAAGHDVAFIARGTHLAALRDRGLAIRSALGELHLLHPVATDDPATLPAADIVFFTVKLWDTEAAAAQIAPLVARGGVVVPFQNGVESIERIGAVVGEERVMGGTAHIAATIAEPGIIAHTGTMARLTFGPAVAAQQAKARQLLDACRAAGIDAELVADVRLAVWKKFVFLAAFSGCTAVARASAGVLRGDPDIRSVFAAAMEEAWRVGRAKGISLPDDFVTQQMRFLDGLPAEMRSSMQIDLEAGRRLEAPWLCGAVVRMARDCGLDAPVNATLYAMLKPYGDGARR